jgi:hypothetical protein
LWATDVMAANTGKPITAGNWENLTFTTWAAAYGGPGATLAGNITTHDAVVHLVTDDVYLNLRFSNFTSGGNFTYQRSTVPEPSSLAGGLVALGALSLRRLRPRANRRKRRQMGRLLWSVTRRPSTPPLPVSLAFDPSLRVRW